MEFAMALQFEQPDPTDPVTMSAEDRCDELASIFARAIVRLPRPGADFREFPAKSPLPCLASSPPFRPHRG
jgi:hypothetical protein